MGVRSEGWWRRENNIVLVEFTDTVQTLDYIAHKISVNVFFRTLDWFYRFYIHDFLAKKMNTPVQMFCRTYCMFKKKSIFENKYSRCSSRIVVLFLGSVPPWSQLFCFCSVCTRRVIIKRTYRYITRFITFNDSVVSLNFWENEVYCKFFYQRVIIKSWDWDFYNVIMSWRDVFFHCYVCLKKCEFRLYMILFRLSNVRGS